MQTGLPPERCFNVAGMSHVECIVSRLNRVACLSFLILSLVASPLGAAEAVSDDGEEEQNGQHGDFFEYIEVTDSSLHP